MAQWINVGTHKALNLDRITYVDAHIYPSGNRIVVTAYDNGSSYDNEPTYFSLYDDDAVQFLAAFRQAVGVAIEPEVHPSSKAGAELDSHEDDSPF